MNKTEKFSKKLDKLLSSHPATLSATWEKGSNYKRYSYKVETHYGIMHVSSNNINTSTLYHIHCRFQDVKQALPSQANPYSGKFNHFIKKRGNCPNKAALELFNVIDEIS